METIKSYTDLSQSKTLSNILSHESADMRFCFSHTLNGRIIGHYPMIGREPSLGTIPAWSFAALFDVLPDGTDIVKDKSDTENEKYMCTVGVKDDIICTFGNNPIDACMAMVEKLHELKML